MPTVLFSHDFLSLSLSRCKKNHGRSDQDKPSQRSFFYKKYHSFSFTVDLFCQPKCARDVFGDLAARRTQLESSELSTDLPSSKVESTQTGSLSRLQWQRFHCHRCHLQRSSICPQKWLNSALTLNVRRVSNLVSFCKLISPVLGLALPIL